ncbi:MAG: thiolase family protein [Gemmatimonadales bacterium]|nr:thiolase family protein [Gemmatimonadales bacterium]
MNLGRVAAIVGMGDAYADEDHRKDPLQLASEATYAALRDASICKSDIQALFTGRAPWADRRPQWNNIFASHLQLPVRLSSEITMHGAGVNAMLGYAAQAIATGLAEYVLCVQSDATPLFIDTVAVGAATDADPQFEYPYGPTIPALYAQIACRYMHEFGVTEEDFARVAVQHQAWGVHHPKAAKRRFGPITVETVLASPYVATPLRRWMCATWGPGGTAGAFIVTSAARAPSHRAAVYIRGFGSCTTHEYLTERMGLRQSSFRLGALPNLTTSGLAQASSDAYRMAGLTPEDVDIVELSGNFSHTVMIALEDLGFCEKGKAVELVRSGRLAPGGDLPLDTNGGWLSFGQPGISCAVDPIVEAVRQLRGEALGLQVKAPTVALTHGAGGMFACHSVTILERG